MTRPLALFAVVVLFLNDHVLKQHWPGLVTGKLSDIAGMIFFPVVLHAVLWYFVAARRKSPIAHDRLLLLACVATAVVFAATKTTVVGNEAYRVVWGLMQWPLHAMSAILRGHHLPGLRRVVLVRDPTDLVAIPFVALAYWTARYCAGRTQPMSSSAATSCGIIVQRVNSTPGSSPG